MKRICVFCGSSTGSNPNFALNAEILGQELVKRNLDLVYGGANVGLMGIVANSVLKAGGEVFGVIPEDFVKRELAHEKITKLHIVRTMHERKALMAKLSDGFIAMPGGLGTIEEIFEVLTWEQLGIHKKPCGFLNIDNYYNFLFKYLKHSISQKLLKEEYYPIILKSDKPATLLNKFYNYKSPITKKWIGLDKI